MPRLSFDRALCAFGAEATAVLAPPALFAQRQFPLGRYALQPRVTRFALCMSGPAACIAFF